MTSDGILESWAVESIADLVNSLYTLDDETIESWPHVDAYRRYLRRNGRDAEAATVVATDLPAVRRLRSRLREVFEAAPGDRPAIVDALLAAFVRGVRLTPEPGGPVVEPVPEDATHGATLAARSAFVLAQLAEAGDLERLKICGFEGCDGALVDRTRPGTQRFCCPKCAARVASRAYRERRRRASNEPLAH